MNKGVLFALNIVNEISDSQFDFSGLAPLVKSLIITHACEHKKTFLSLRRASKELCLLVGKYSMNSWFNLDPVHIFKCPFMPLQNFFMDLSIWYIQIRRATIREACFGLNTLISSSPQFKVHTSSGFLYEIMLVVFLKSFKRHDEAAAESIAAFEYVNDTVYLIYKYMDTAQVRIDHPEAYLNLMQNWHFSNRKQLVSPHTVFNGYWYRALGGKSPGVAKILRENSKELTLEAWQHILWIGRKDAIKYILNFYAGNDKEKYDTLVQWTQEAAAPVAAAEPQAKRSRIKK
jgi:hypothetical protein